jgi:hypothetical protein
LEEIQLLVNAMAHPALLLPSRRQLLLVLAGALTLGMGAIARAGSITAESIWDKGNAIQRAQSQLPAGASVTRTDCTEVNVRTGNYRYICTVFYTDPPARPAATLNPSTSPSAPSAPAP